MAALCRSVSSLARLLPCFQRVHNITSFPKPLGDSGRHYRCGPQRLMDADEIVVRRKQRDRMGVVLDLL